MEKMPPKVKRNKKELPKIEEIKGEDVEMKEGIPKKNIVKSSVIRLTQIPFGFFEKQLNGYFKQFGTVNRVRVDRNKRVSRK